MFVSYRDILSGRNCISLKALLVANNALSHLRLRPPDLRWASKRCVMYIHVNEFSVEAFACCMRKEFPKNYGSRPSPRAGIFYARSWSSPNSPRDAEEQARHVNINESERQWTHFQPLDMSDIYVKVFLSMLDSLMMMHCLIGAECWRTHLHPDSVIYGKMIL